MTQIHWIGTGLSAVPGLRRLIENGRQVTVWNRSTDKAHTAVGDLTDNIKAFTLDAVKADLAAGDILVSMLPGDWHVPLAELCLAKGAHFVSSSYISPEMRALDSAAKKAGLALVNEVGLDPGIDHLMAHWLVADYRASAGYDAKNDISFVSYCGGVPKIANAFRYKFSWSPLGVLKALRSPSRSIANFSEISTANPWDALSTYNAPLQQAESFEVYPNRDSLPFMAEYGFDKDWSIKQFVRGTLRLNGWADAWDGIAKECETLEGPEGDARLVEMADEMWKNHAYDEGEPDRVILCVGLKAEQGGKAVYDKTYVLDAHGTETATAMASLVSIPVSLAIEAVAAGKIEAGVTAAPSDPELLTSWLAEVDAIAQHLAVLDQTT